MIYYNYPPFYHSPLNLYPNIQYPRTVPDNNLAASTMSNIHANKVIKKNVQNQRPSDGINLNTKNSKVSSQFMQKEIPRKKNSSYDESIFEILGIKLYFDDILLICLIFFLYTEGVQDQYLFIVLILLLLS